MANRHKVCKKLGGPVYQGAGSNVVKEAKSNANYKRGGVTKIMGSAGKSRIKKARGGSCDQSPFSSAHRG